MKPLLTLLLWMVMETALAGARLQSMDFAALPGERMEFIFKLNGSPGLPRDFQTENPARIILDLPGVSNGLGKASIPVNRGGVQSVRAIEAAGRSRIVIDLARIQPYSIKTEDQRIRLRLEGEVKRPENRMTPRSGELQPSVISSGDSYGQFPGSRDLVNIDFRRGEKGEGRVLITLGNSRAMVDVRREGKKIAVWLPDSNLPSRLARRLDVIDFATPIHYIEANTETTGSRIIITPISGQFEFSSYQSGTLLAVDVREVSESRQRLSGERQIRYSGNKLTLNFQDIPVRSVLQILADFTGINIVASDAVDGNVTLRLQDVPWDQALDLVLQAKGLGKRQVGNIISVAPNEELVRQSLDRQAAEEAEPLRTEVFQINYTKAEEIKKILMGVVEKPNTGTLSGDAIDSGYDMNPPGDGSAAMGGDINQSIMSARGQITTDPRTNQIIVLDTANNLDRVRDLIRKLDKPVRQVLIESRIVIATNEFLRELGARLSLNRAASVNQQSAGNTDYALVPPPDAGGVSGDALVDLASAAAAGAGGYFGVTFLKVGEYLLDLELSAAQTDRRTEIVSTPKLVTADGVQAYIMQGQVIPYAMTPPGSIGTNVRFRDAVLELKVTPHITADENILMDLGIKKDAPGQQQANGNRDIEKREIQTSALVSNGETMVLGGVFEGDQENKTDKVPFLGDLPGIGFMFRRDLVKNQKRELLIFITPKIIGSQLAGM